MKFFFSFLMCRMVNTSNFNALSELICQILSWKEDTGFEIMRVVKSCFLMLTLFLNTLNRFSHFVKEIIIPYLQRYAILWGNMHGI